MTVWNLLNYARLQNAHKLRKKTFAYCVTVVCTNIGEQNRNGFVWAVMINPPEVPINWRNSKRCTHCKQRCAAMLAHTQACHIKKWNGKLVMHASKSQLNQAGWNRTVSKFASENQINVHNYLSILFCDFPFIARSGKVTSWAWLGVRRTPRAMHGSQTVRRDAMVHRFTFTRA